MSLSPGSRVGPYAVVSLLGAGGMGEVYRARDPRLNRDVAIKVLRPELADAADSLQRFEREAQTLAALNHPNIAHIHGVEVGHPEGADGHESPYLTRALVMELVEGEDLSARIARGPIPLDEALGMARQIADALEAAHEQGIVHRDLKPANVKVRADGTVKVLDFGLGKLFALNQSPEGPGFSPGSLTHSPTFTSPAGTVAGVILGTAAYMSPEQARGKPVDKRADIWAFGVVLYEMLSGRQLFAGETVTDVLAAVVTRDPDWSILPSTTPTAVRHLLRRCLDKDPRSRLRDIGEARVALASPGTPDVAPTARVASSTSMIGRWLPWAIAAVALIAVGSMWAITRPAPPPLRKLELALPSNALFSLSPDGTRLAIRTADHVSVSDLQRLERRELATSTAAPRSIVFWSPQSDFIGYTDGDAKLWIVPAAGGTPRLVCTIPGTGQLMSAVWRRDGSIVMGTWRGNLYSVPATGGQPSTLVAVDPKREVDFHDSVALPDGRLLMSTHVGGAQQSYRIELLSALRQDSGQAGQREVVIEGPFQLIGLDANHLLVTRFDVNEGIWAIPFRDQLPLRIEDGFLVAPGAISAPPTVAAGTLLYGLDGASAQPRELVWVDRAGNVISQVGPARPDLHAPVLSPDMQRVAFVAGTDNHDIWVRDLQSFVDTRITPDPGRRTLPTWMPGATPDRVAYSEVATIETQRVAVSQADGSGRRVQLASGVGAAFSPDGRHLAFIVDERGAFLARVAPIAADGTVGASKPLLNIQPEPNVLALSISPDGAFVAYVERHTGGAMELFLTRFPSGDGRWQISTGGARSPAWSRSGELFFVTGTNQGPKQLSVVPITLGSTPTIGTPSALFPLSDTFSVIAGLGPTQTVSKFDVAPDGKRLLMVRTQSGSESTRRWVLVQNWLSEFKN